MPGFLGLRKQDVKTALDADRERRERTNRKDTQLIEHEKRSWEKVQEVLKNQQDAEQDALGADEEGERRQESGAGKSSLKVSDVMSGRVATVKFDDIVLTVKGIFMRVRFHHLPVVDENGCVIGIISDRDFLASMSPFVGTVNEQARDVELLKRKVGLIMTRNPSCATAGTDIIDAIRIMNERKVSCLPVIAEGTLQLLGIVTWKDIVRAFCPEAFANSKDTGLRIKTGVNVRPRITDSGRFLPSDIQAADGGGSTPPETRKTET